MKSTYRISNYCSAARPKLKAVVRWKNDEGKYERKFFNTRDEAKTFAQQRETELLNQGREVMNFPSWLRIMAQECQAQLAKRGKTLRDATAHYVKHLDASGLSVTLEKAYATFIEGKMTLNVSKGYLQHLRLTLNKRFIPMYAGKLVSDVTVLDCEAWVKTLNKLKPFSRNIYLNLLGGFFEWAKVRGYCEKNPALQVPFAKTEETPAGIVSVDDLAKLLEAADPQMLAYVAIGAFAGIRAAELKRLDWSEIDLEDGFIEVKASKAKSARRRLVKIQPCLDAWLRPIAQKSGAICHAPNMNRFFARLRVCAGLVGWPKNALRHSFASYHLARFKNAAELALEMGHTGTSLIFAHYRQVVRDSEALRFWNIFPQEPENVLAFAQKNIVPRSTHERWERAEGGAFKRLQPGAAYRKTNAEYAKQYGVRQKTVNRWMAQGRPLDDVKAMEKIGRGEYEKTQAQYAEIYQASQVQVAQWMLACWPLDNIQGMKGYLARKSSNAMGSFTSPANRALRVVGLSAKDARGAAVEAAQKRTA